MKMIMEFMNNFIDTVSGVLYQPWCVPLLLLAGGIILTIRSKLMQARLFTECFKVITEKPTTKGGISSFGALMVSTASRVGTGNIIGVATAICAGGAGAVFWMWITAIIGGASAFVESTLAQIYKKRNADGTSYGGPAFYMRDALGQRWLGVLFSCLIILTYAVGYNMLAAYNLQDTFSVFGFYTKGTTPMIIGAILAVLFGVIVIGGAKRLTKSTEIMVPFMGILYVLVSLVVLILNADRLGEMFAMIFESAFDFKAIFGGFTGSCMMNGIKRGLYSNEAGIGSSPNAAATADVSHPAKQGLVQMLSVFIDTLLICTATAFMCLSSGASFGPEIGGAALCADLHGRKPRRIRPGLPVRSHVAFRIHDPDRELFLLRRLSAIYLEQSGQQGRYSGIQKPGDTPRICRCDRKCGDGLEPRGHDTRSDGTRQSPCHSHSCKTRLPLFRGLLQTEKRRQKSGIHCKRRRH